MSGIAECLGQQVDFLSSFERATWTVVVACLLLVSSGNRSVSKPVFVKQRTKLAVRQSFVHGGEDPEMEDPR